MKVPFAALLPLVALPVSSLFAQSTIVFSDDFSTNTRANYYVSSGSTSVAVENEVLRVNAGRSVFTYFDMTPLAVGESLTVTFDFSASAWGTQAAGLRFGLFNSDGVQVSDGANTGYTGFTGYTATTNPVGSASSPMAVRERIPNTGISGEGALMTTNDVYTLLGSGGPQSQSFVATDVYTGMLTIERTGDTTNLLTYTITGTGLTNYTMTYEHTNSTVTAFDGFGLSTTNATLVDSNGRIFLDNIVVTHTIPEPATLAALAGLAAFGIVVLRRRKSV